MLEETIARNTAQITVLTAEYSGKTFAFFNGTSNLTADNFDLNRRLESIESGEKNNQQLWREESI